MKAIISLFLIILYWNGFGQSAGNPSVSSSATNAIQPLSVQKPVIVSNKFYKEINNNPSDGNSWLNYYTWLNNSKDVTAIEKKQQLSQTIQSAQKFIAASWQYALMNFIQSGKRDKNYLDAAFENSADRSVVYPYAIQYAILSKDKKLLNEYAVALNELSPLTPALYEYHYNCLQSAGANATIYAKGLTDLAPMAILQQVYGLRKDVSFAYYENKITDTANTYVCLSAGKEIMESYPNAGYSGLLIKIANAETTEELVRHAANFSFIELQSLNILKADEKLIYKNYLPGCILIYRFYKTNNHPAAAEWKERIQKIATLTGTTDIVNKMLGQ